MTTLRWNGKIEELPSFNELVNGVPDNSHNTMVVWSGSIHRSKLGQGTDMVLAVVV